MSTEKRHPAKPQPTDMRTELALDPETVKDLEPNHGAGEQVRGGQGSRNCNSNMT